jgi:hypothetical protein
MTPPNLIGGALVIHWSLIDERHHPTGACQHVVAGSLRGPASGLAICQNERDGSYYLFGCDAAWHPVTDTWHETLEEALEQAELEYEGVGQTWSRG